MGKVLRDIKRILILAKDVQKELQKNNVKVAIRKIKKIINLDIDELSRTQKEGDKKLLEECAVVLKDAKEILKILRHDENSSKIEHFVNEIIKLEGHELIERSDYEKRKDELYKFWVKKIRTKKYYHGTSNLSVPQIKRYGLAPGMKPPFWKDFQRLYNLYKKAGVSNPLKLIHAAQGVSGIVRVGIFVTDSYPMAKRYALKSPAIWHEFVEGLNQREARRKFLLEAFFMGDPFNEIKKECEEIYDRNIRNFYDQIINHFIKKGMKKEEICLLSKQEVYEIKRIFEKLWLEFKDQKPIILHISVLAPGIADEEPFTQPEETKSFLYDFMTFVRDIEDIAKDKSLEDAKREFERIFFRTKLAHGYELHVKRKIPKKFIEIEYV